MTNIEKEKLDAAIGKIRINCEDAIEELNSLLRISPQNPRVHCALGMAWHECMNYGVAMGFYDSAIAIDPHYARAFFNRGVLLVDLGKTASGIEEFDTAITLAQEPRFYGQRALAKILMNDFASAIVDLIQCQELERSDYANYLLAVCHFNLGQYQVALSCLESICTEACDEALYWSWKSHCHVALKQGQLAIESSKKAISIQDNEGEFFLIYGHACLVSNLCQEAIVYYEIAMSLDKQLSSECEYFIRKCKISN